MSSRTKRILLLVLLLLGGLLCALLSLSVGASGITLVDCMDDGARQILLEVRLPRVLMALAAGAALAASGVALQSMLANPLAEPFALGISGGGAVGALVAMAVGLVHPLATPVAAWLGGLFSLLAVHFLARVEGRLPSDRLILSGFVMNVLLGAVITLCLVRRADLVHEFTFWLMGSLSAANPVMVTGMIGYSIIGIGLLWLLSPSLNALALGEEMALSLGVNVERTKMVAALLSALLTGVVVAAAGMIAFVGLIVPHICRRFIGPDTRWLIPASVLLGALFLSLCDLIGRMLLSPFEIPVGVLTALLGGGFFFFILRAGSSRRGGVL